MKCHICGKTEIKKIKRINKVDIYECQKCGLAFVDQSKVAYSDDLNTLYDIKAYKSQEKKLRSTFTPILNELARNKEYGKVLDVGGGFGLFSSMLYDTGRYEIDVIEPANTLFYLKNKKVNVFRNNIEEFLAYNRQRYDIVVMLDVLEHLKQPVNILKKIRSILIPGGLVIVQTPNYRSLMQFLCKHWAWWMVEDHKYFFSPQSLRKTYSQSGYAVKQLSTYEHIYDFKKNLDGNFTGIYINWLRKSIKALYFTVFFPFYLIFRRIIWKIGGGGLILAMGSPR